MTTSTKVIILVVRIPADVGRIRNSPIGGERLVEARHLHLGDVIQRAR